MNQSPYEIAQNYIKRRPYMEQDMMVFAKHFGTGRGIPIVGNDVPKLIDAGKTPCNTIIAEET